MRVVKLFQLHKHIKMEYFVRNKHTHVVKRRVWTGRGEIVYLGEVELAFCLNTTKILELFYLNVPTRH